MAMNEAEKNALNEKLENPEKTVKCPKCGKELEYKEYPNCTAVRCKTDGCIRASIRGI